MLGQSSIINKLFTVTGVSVLACVVFIAVMMVLLIKIFNINIWIVFKYIFSKLISFTGKIINKKEKRYHRDVTIGKLSEKRIRVKTYKFLNDLAIDLGLKRRGANPYELLLLIIVVSAIISLLACQLIFNSMLMGIIMLPITFAGLMCGLYTKANISHDARIEAVIEAENIISNNIKDGVVVAVRNNLDVMPLLVRAEFKDFLDNIELKNYHIKTALLELNNNLGSTANDFIKKCIVFEMEEEHGIVGMFSDIVEINNVKTDMRTEMKRKFEEVSTEFVISALMIFVFLGGTVAIFDIVADFYFRTLIGQLIIALDILIIIGEFVYITYLRAREL